MSLSLLKKFYIAFLAVFSISGVIFLAVGASYVPTKSLPKETETSDQPNSQFELRVDLPGITSPAHDPADMADLADDEMVIGVNVGDESRAYRLSALAAPGLPASGGPDLQSLGKHVVNDSLGGQQLCVTYCDRNDSTNVFASVTSAPLSVGVGGWSRRGRLVLTHNNHRFDQDQSADGLKEFPYTVVSWGDWKAAHPQSTLYIGNNENSQ